MEASAEEGDEEHPQEREAVEVEAEVRDEALLAVTGIPGDVDPVEERDDPRGLALSVPHEEAGEGEDEGEDEEDSEDDIADEGLPLCVKLATQAAARARERVTARDRLMEFMGNICSSLCAMSDVLCLPIDPGTYIRLSELAATVSLRGGGLAR